MMTIVKGGPGRSGRYMTGTFTLSCHLAPWGSNFKQGFEHIAKAGFRHIEAGSNVLFAYEARLGQLQELLAEAALAMPVIFELGHFENWARRREIYLHHDRLAGLMVKMSQRFVVLAPGFSFRREQTIEGMGRMLRMIEEIMKRYHHAGIEVGLHPHLGSHLFTEAQIGYVMERLHPRPYLVPDLGHMAEAEMEMIPFLQTYKSMIRCLHVRDVVHIRTKHDASRTRYTRRTKFCMPGRGQLEWDHLFRWLDNSGYDGWITTEWEEKEVRGDELAAKASAAYTFLTDKSMG